MDWIVRSQHAGAFQEGLCISSLCLRSAGSYAVQTASQLRADF